MRCLTCAHTCKHLVGLKPTTHLMAEAFPDNDAALGRAMHMLRVRVGGATCLTLMRAHVRTCCQSADVTITALAHPELWPSYDS